MAYLFSDLQSEVARRSTKNQSGTQFTTAIKNVINTSIERISREANWKQLRRRGSFNTIATYSTGTVTATLGSRTITGASTLWLTNTTAAIAVGRRMTIGGSSQRYTITAIGSDTSITVDYAYDGTTASALTYTIYGQEFYNLPIQTNKEAFIYHEKFGFPYVLRYLSSHEFYSSSVNTLISYTPTHYSMWDVDTLIAQPTSASVASIVSSSTADTTQSVTFFGIVAGYPDSETLNVNGTTTVNGAKSFTSFDRIAKNASTTGRITCTSNSAANTLAVLPTGYQTDSIRYKKIQVFPLPDAAFPMQVYYYKQPFRLVNDGDVHELGDAFDEAIILLATTKIKLESNVEEGTNFMKLYMDEIKSLKEYNVDKLDWLPSLLKPGSQGFYSKRLNRFLSYANLGGSYGPGGVM